MVQILKDASAWTVDTPPRIVDAAVIAIPGDVADAVSAGASSIQVERWVHGVAEALDRLPHGIALRPGTHAADTAAARVLAHRIARMVRDALVQRGAPANMEVEFGAEQSSTIASGRRYRTLLPHHDGGNASFLTPSVVDEPRFSARHRRTRVRAVTTTRRHKMYQGFFLRATGDFESVTTYYDLLSVLRAAYRHQTGTWPSAIAELARWTGTNIRRTLDLIEVHGGTYVTLAGLLGAVNPVHALIAVHHAEASFDREQIARYPELARLNMAQGSDLSPTEALFDRALAEVSGEGWLAFRQRYEAGVTAMAHDLMLGHNLTLLHGGWRGGCGRIIEPICFVLDDPSGDAYESWLSRAWRRSPPDGPSGHDGSYEVPS